MIVCKLVRAFLLALLLLLLLPTITKNAYQAEITVYEGNYEEETCGIDYSPVTEEEIKEVIDLVFTGESNAWGNRVASCESSFRQFDSDTNTVLFNGSCCYGVFQYCRSTFSAYCEGDIERALDQILCWECR